MNSINRDYFEWIFEMMDGGKHGSLSFRKLLECLNSIEFIYSIPMDENRAEDGVDLRYRYSYYNNLPDIPDCGPPSVLEVIAALAIRCEEEMMDNPDLGDRTSQWFWIMIRSLGLQNMTDGRFDEEYTREVIDKFLNREYESNGKGGLFTIYNCDYDLRDVEIWYQMCWYLNTLV